MARIITALALLLLALEGDPPTFKVTTKKIDDTVQIRPEKDKIVFVIRSPSGISEAVIERKQETWPKFVVLRLRLKGFENFTVSNGKVTMHAAVSV